MTELRPARQRDSAEVEWVARRAGHVSKTIKGLLVALAAALALGLTDDAGAAALGLAGTVAAVLFSNVYADSVQQEIQTGERLGRTGLLAVVGHAIGIPLGALPAFLVFAAAWLGLMATDIAIDVAIWSGIVLLFALGYGSGRLRGDDKGHALLHGVFLAIIGLAVLAVNSLH